MFQQNQPKIGMLKACLDDFLSAILYIENLLGMTGE